MSKKKTKRKKKPTQVQNLNKIIAELTYQVKKGVENLDYYVAILERIRLIFPPVETRFGSKEKITIEKLPLRIAELYGRQLERKGMVQADTEAIKRLQEIIKWLIKPSTAEPRKITREDIEVMEHLKKSGRFIL